jgi:hypothetical protein
VLAPGSPNPADDYARMLHARDSRGDAAPARALLDSALETYRELELGPPAEAATGLAKEVGSTT